MQVIGAGLGRTGTKSLQVALEDLGFGQCYHMEVLYQRHEHAKLWYQRVRGKPVDWQQIFGEYGATMDFPGCCFYRELLEAYPDAKVVLSVRDSEGWYESTLGSIYQMPLAMPLWLRWMLPPIRHAYVVTMDLYWNGLFGGRFAHRQEAIDIFERWNEDVIKSVPADRLLVFDVKEGWEPLCRFLGVEVPKDRPFPRVNERAEMQKKVRTLRLVRHLGRAAAAALAVGGLYLLLA